jgi:hypothetical protein
MCPAALQAHNLTTVGIDPLPEVLSMATDDERNAAISDVEKTHGKLLQLILEPRDNGQDLLGCVREMRADLDTVRALRIDVSYSGGWRLQFN